MIGGHFKYVAPDKTVGGCYEDPSRCVQRLRLAALDLEERLERDWDPGVTGHYSGVRQEHFARLSG